MTDPLSSPSTKQAFVAGVLVTSAIWSLVMRLYHSYTLSFSTESPSVQTKKEEEDHNKNMVSVSESTDIQQGIQYNQLIELRTSLIEHSKRTTLLLLDSIIHQAKLLDFPNQKRLRWPWESLRQKEKSVTSSTSPKGLVKKKETNANQDETLQESLIHRNSSSDRLYRDDTTSSSVMDESSSSDISLKNESLDREICIGSIFGLDVGGTLSKLVYFEKKKRDHWNRQNGSISRSNPVSMIRTLRRYHSIGGGNSSLDMENQEETEDTKTKTFPSHYSTGQLGLHPPSIDIDSHSSSDNVENSTNQQISFDKGNSIKRSSSLFDFHSKQAKTEIALNQFYDFAKKLDSVHMDVKDKNLSYYSRALGGEFHFIQFETRYLPEAINLIKFNDLHKNISKMGATGGGAHKYHSQWKDMLGIEMQKKGELDSLVAGMQFILSDVGECYTFAPDSSSNSMTHLEDGETRIAENDGKHHRSRKSMIDLYWASQKVKRDYIADTDSYPYILVMIGTGVSVLRIDGPRKHERVSGSTIGGGTYWGLCRLLTDVENFPDALALAEKGDPSKVDMMVGDIYGNERDALEKLGLSSDVVASSFGKLVSKQDPAAGLKQEDLARALLLMVTNNIGQVAFLNAQLHKCKRIYFVGNFLRHNVISQKRLAYAINFWSRGKMEALFLEHEGYFGAIGAFLLHQGIIADKHGNVAQEIDSDSLLRNKHKRRSLRKRSTSL